MTDLQHTDPALVSDAKITDTPRANTATGYGPKIPTCYMLRYSRRWQRVYMMQYGNSGSPYILRGGIVHHLDIDTTHLLEALTEGGRSTDPKEGSTK